MDHKIEADKIYNRYEVKINGHTITQKDEFLFSIDNEVDFMNVPGAGIAGTAWDANQKSLVQETLPNVEFQPHPNDDGLSCWKFYGKAG